MLTRRGSPGAWWAELDYRICLVGFLVLFGCAAETEDDAQPAPLDPIEHECLALAMYWEAKSEPQAGLEAVGHVVMNRLRDERFPDTICAVTKQGGERRGCQFSWYCDGRSDVPREADNWRRAQDAASALMRDELDDNTDGALFFHARRLDVPWRVQREQTAEVGDHIFYR